MYLAYGDRRILEEIYPSMKGWVGYMLNYSQHHLWNRGLPWWTYGDWLFYEGEDPSWSGWGPPAPTDIYFIGQCYFGHSLQLLINSARVLGRTEDVAQYSALLEKVKQAFVHEYVTPGGRLAVGTQTAYVLALHFDMLPDSLRQQAVRRLADKITEYQGHFTTGELGVQYIAPVLARFGYADTAYKLLLQKSYPSWLYPVTRGATTLWERWDTIRPDSTFANPVMNSFNLPAMGGSVADWLYREVAAIDTYEDGPGYKHSKIRPRLPSRSDSTLTSAQGSLETYYGQLSSSWKREGTTFRLDVQIPPNTSATVFVPTRDASSVSEGGKKLSTRKDIKVVGTEEGYVVLHIGSGTYSFGAVL
jgi:alpha-L-rhamnosidase